MKIIFLILFFNSITTFGYAQMNPSELMLKTGEKLIVQGKISGDYIKYKLHSKDKSKKLHFSEIDHVKIRFSKDDIKTYRYLKVKGSEKSRVLEEKIKGKVSLYTTSTSGYHNPFGYGINRIEYTIENYFVKRKDDVDITHLGSNQLITKDFIEAATMFFSDCKQLVEKVKNKELKKRDIVQIVQFYNKNCDKTDYPHE